MLEWGRGAPTTGADSRGRGETGVRRGPTRHPVLVVLACSAALSACSLHVSKHGISGNILGHSFSGATGQLPTGFPSSVPQPNNSRVMAGAGTNDHWDVAFAVTGSVTSGTTAYESKCRSAGYTITNIRSGSTPVTSEASSDSTSTTVTLTGAGFSATSSTWTVQVVSGTTSSSTGGGLRAGEFAINVTVVPTTSSSSPPA